MVFLRIEANVLLTTLRNYSCFHEKERHLLAFLYREKYIYLAPVPRHQARRSMGGVDINTMHNLEDHLFQRCTTSAVK
jgi:hypothetical protein